MRHVSELSGQPRTADGSVHSDTSSNYLLSLDISPKAAVKFEADRGCRWHGSRSAAGRHGRST